jgi:DHA3 family tetracycline resistance protein-like MFS transporter
MIGAMLRRTTRLDPAFAYYILKCGHAFFFTMVVSVSLIWQTQEVGLNPIQLLLVAAALQGTILLSEMPTGVVADTYGRRRSVVIGFLLLGFGIVISGSVASFAPIFLGHVLWGFGHTFISGADEAWIADEVGVEHANRIYLRGAQLTKLFWVAAIPVSIGIATTDLNLPILLGGSCLMVLGLFLAAAMPEQAFQRVDRAGVGDTVGSLHATLRQGTSAVRASPLLLTILAIMAFYGMAGQGFQVLWVAHFDANITFPTIFGLQPLIWFGAIRMAAAVLSIVAIEGIRRWRLESMNSHSAVSRGLFWINAMQMLSILTMAATGDFWIAAASYCIALALSTIYDPLHLAWINQNVDTRVRATVMSMSSQSEALGKTAGGPLIGVVASVLSLRSALAVAGVAIFPALLFYFRAFGQGTRPQEVEERVQP